MSCLFLVTASRMRACACDTASRLCVRTVLCSSAFSLVPPLRSTSSAAVAAALFAGFAATIGQVRLLRPVHHRLRPPAFPTRPGHDCPRDGDGDLPVPAQEASAHARVYDDAGWPGLAMTDTGRVAFCMDGRHRHPGLLSFAAQYLACTPPLSTLRVLPRGRSRA